MNRGRQALFRMTPHIIYIHGAHATPTSFNYIKHRLPHHTHTDVVYDANEPLDESIDRALLYVDRPSHIVAHSLGGVIGVALSHAYPELVKSVTTMSTPFGGSEVASQVAMFLPFNTFLKNIHVFSPTLQSITRTRQTVPLMSFVTTAGGNSLQPKPNDGVVTVDSQLAYGSHHIMVDLNHFEVLLCPSVATQIGHFVLHHDK